MAESVAEGDPPDIAVAPQPGTVLDLAREGHLIDLGTYLDLDALRNDQSPYLVSLGTIGDDGSWPASKGATYGVFVSSSQEPDLVSVARAWLGGSSDPTDVGRTHVAQRSTGSDGRTPWCMGWGSGTAVGVARDRLDREPPAGGGRPEVYDQWTFHEIPFDARRYARRSSASAQILFTEGYLAEGGREGRPSFDGRSSPMVKEDPPGCWLYQFPDFARRFVPPDRSGPRPTSSRSPPSEAGSPASWAPAT